MKVSYDQRSDTLTVVFKERVTVARPTPPNASAGPSASRPSDA